MNKEQQHISELLKHFDEAQTTLAEERELEQYFASHEQVPPEPVQLPAQQVQRTQHPAAGVNLCHLDLQPVQDGGRG